MLLQRKCAAHAFENQGDYSVFRSVGQNWDITRLLSGCPALSHKSSCTTFNRTVNCLDRIEQEGTGQDGTGQDNVGQDG